MTKIAWTDETWNIVAGCTRVSSGCDNCYAARMTRRLEWMGVKKCAGLANAKHFNGIVRCDEAALENPFGWLKSRRVFVNSMSDTFHEKVPQEFIYKMDAVMALCPQHIFQVLTKRPELMAEHTNTENWKTRIVRAAMESPEWDGYLPDYDPNLWLLDDDRQPLPNVWLGTSIEDQATADERIPHLLRCPAAVRFLSVEPMLEPINFATRAGGRSWLQHTDVIPHIRNSIQWVIIGGESEAKARPFHLEWARELIAQCREAGVAVFVKQLGCNPFLDGKSYKPGNDKRTDPADWPEDLRVQEYPRA